MFRHLILATTIAVALSGCTQMAADSRPHTDTGTPDISTFLHPENARPDGMSDTPDSFPFFFLHHIREVFSCALLFVGSLLPSSAWDATAYHWRSPQ
ncbi:hypothetical protein BK260_26400 [Escherichia coli]|uniref:hypothetical protein n=1 Tax=Escherichia coli TaxID=562 RepID=UPI000925889F|nr:hypothetical protein [Escherichia coli]OJL28393.1 hypothetical protein BK260_26400 [Escherichia coli]